MREVRTKFPGRCPGLCSCALTGHALKRNATCSQGDALGCFVAPFQGGDLNTTAESSRVENLAAAYGAG